MSDPASKPRAGATALLYISFFVAVTTPTFVLLIAGFLGPEPYVLVQAELEPYADKARRRQEAEVETKRFDDRAAARDATKRYTSRIPKRQAQKTMHVHRYVREDNDRYELVMPIDNVLLRISGRDREHVDAVFDDLPFVTANPEKNWVWVLTTEYLKELLIAIALYVVLLTIVFSRAASRVARVPAPNGVEPVDAARLRERLLALSSLEIPFQIKETRGGRLEATWRLADAEWSSILRKAGLRHAHSLGLELDETRSIVRVIHTTTEVSWATGPMSFLSRFNWSRNVAFYRRATGTGFGVTPSAEGWTLNETYHYRYELGEIVQPVARAILESGWEFRPVFTFFRPLGG